MSEQTLLKNHEMWLKAKKNDIKDEDEAQGQQVFYLFIYLAEDSAKGYGSPFMPL